MSRDSKGLSQHVLGLSVERLGELAQARRLRHIITHVPTFCCRIDHTALV